MDFLVAAGWLNFYMIPVFGQPRSQIRTLVRFLPLTFIIVLHWTEIAIEKDSEFLWLFEELPRIPVSKIDTYYLKYEYN